MTAQHAPIPSDAGAGAGPRAAVNAAAGTAAARPRTRIPSLGARGEGWVVLQLLFVALLLLAGLGGPAWSGPARVAGTVAGVALVLAGLGLMASGIARLRQQLTPFPHPVAEGELLTDGPFALVRHPMYAGGIVLAVGWGLATASLPALGVAVLVVGFLDLKSRREEAWLRERFPGYAAYAARTRKLIPLLY